MKWTLLGLLLLGLIAAVSASVLMAGLRGEPRIIQMPADQPVGEVEVVMAARGMGPLTVVDAKSVRTKRLPADRAPAGFVNGSALVIGNLLTVPVVEGQVFTENCFAKAGSAVSLASALPEGMRAVTLSLSESAGLTGLAYPGCVVDVLVSFGVPGKRNSQVAEAISMTLLQGVEVLAIGDQTVFSATDKEASPKARRRNSSRFQRLVTVMVDPDQAKALQLAMKYGTLSLALRNPLDAATVTSDRTRLSSLSDDYSGLLRQLEALKDPAAASDRPQSVGAGSVRQAVARAESPTGHDNLGPMDEAVGAPAQWEMIIIRGPAIESRSFPWPVDEVDG